IIPVLALLLSPLTASAVPSFARQTGLDCGTCHLSWLELGPVGRAFKLGGYTLTKQTTEERPWFSLSTDGPPPRLPLAGMLQASLTHTAETAGNSDAFPRNDDLVLQQASLFYAGRIVDHL